MSRSSSRPSPSTSALMFANSYVAVLASSSMQGWLWYTDSTRSEGMSSVFIFTFQMILFQDLLILFLFFYTIHIFLSFTLSLLYLADSNWGFLAGPAMYWLESSIVSHFRQNDKSLLPAGQDPFYRNLLIWKYKKRTLSGWYQPTMILRYSHQNIFRILEYVQAAGCTWGDI